MSRGRKNRKSNRVGTISVSLIVFTLLIVMSIQIWNLHQKNREYVAQEKSLQQQLSEETERQEELKNYEAYTKTQDYIQDIAKSKLGLIHNNEIVFKEKDK
jgi:cell division protein DivIC